MTVKSPKPPAGTGWAGAKLWRAVMELYELEAHEENLLVQAVRVADNLDALHVLVAAEGVVVASPQGDRANPALVESRQQQIVLARLLAALRLPAGAEDEGADRRPQRREMRGVYGVRGSVA